MLEQQKKLNLEKNLQEYIPSQRQLKQLDHILSLQTACDKRRIPICVVGGYGIDALYGQLTRDHYDLEVFIQEANREQFMELLGEFNYVSNPDKIFSDKCVLFTTILGGIPFQIDLRTLEQLDEDRKWDYEEFFTSEPIGKLNGHPIKTTTIKGYEEMMEAFKKRALKKGWLPYDKAMYNQELFERIKKKYM